MLLHKDSGSASCFSYAAHLSTHRRIKNCSVAGLKRGVEFANMATIEQQPPRSMRFQQTAIKQLAFYDEITRSNHSARASSALDNRGIAHARRCNSTSTPPHATHERVDKVGVLPEGVSMITPSAFIHSFWAGNVESTRCKL